MDEPFIASTITAVTLMIQYLSAVCCILTIVGTHAQAQVRYDFVDRQSGSILATLALAELPATNSDVVALDFSPAGVALFGLGETYEGTFDRTTGFSDFIIDDGTSKLGGLAAFVDDDPPFSSLSGFLNPAYHFALTATSMQMVESPANGQPTTIFRSGDWMRVPEPSTMLSLLVVAAVFALRFRVKKSISDS